METGSGCFLIFVKVFQMLCGQGCVVMGSLLKPSGHFRVVKYLLIFTEKKKKKKSRFCLKPRFESESFRTQTNGLFVDSGLPCQEPITKE